jgi:uncharacterized protein (DUF983 family)
MPKHTNIAVTEKAVHATERAGVAAGKDLASGTVRKPKTIDDSHEFYARSDERSVGLSMWRGIVGRCPNCGRGRLFRTYLKVADNCSVCGEELFHQQADDAPPYFTMAIVGHIVIALMLAVEISYQPPIWVHLSLWVPLTIVLSLALLPIVKGSIVGMQWANRMHGFGGEADQTAS